MMVGHLRRDYLRHYNNWKVSPDVNLVFANDVINDQDLYFSFSSSFARLSFYFISRI